MDSTAQIARHPIHPMLIPYPFTLLTTAAGFDLASKLTRRHALARTGSQVTRLGIGAALMAAVPGIIDYFYTVPARTQARRTATLHALANLSGVACFALAESRRRHDGRLPGAGQLTLQLAGTALLCAGGWLGGNLVYHHRIGVVEEAAGEPMLPGRERGAAGGERVRPIARPRVPEPVA